MHKENSFPNIKENLKIFLDMGMPDGLPETCQKSSQKLYNEAAIPSKKRFQAQKTS